MHRIMVRPLQAGVRLTAIFDSCHSGTALDLPYIYSTQGILKEPNLAKEAGQGLLGAVSAYSRGDLGGVANNIMGFFKKAGSSEDAYARSMAIKTSPADVVMFSGSKDDQTSCVAFFLFSLVYLLLTHRPNLQSRRDHRLASNRRHVLGLHHGPHKEPAAELRAAAQQHPRRAADPLHPEAPAVV
jgi:hypothetical protein